MRSHARSRGSRAIAALAIALLGSSLACDQLPSRSDGDGSRASGGGCLLPDVVELDQTVAQRQLVEIGIVPIRQDAPSGTVPRGHVVSMDPAAGTLLDPCEGMVVLVVSQGQSGEARDPTATPPSAVEDTPTPPIVTGGKQPLPAQDDLPLFLTSHYEETFDDRFFGFRPEWAVDASVETVDSRVTESGELVVDGHLAAYVGDDTWYDYLITLGGADYSGTDRFGLLARAQDDANYVWLGCQVSAGDLRCAGHIVVDGEARDVLDETDRLCSAGQIRCDISLEAIRDQYRLLVNGEERAAFSDSTFSSGGVGLTVDGRLVLDYFDVLDPGSPASHAFTLFRDDFDTAGWFAGEDDGDYAVSVYRVEDGAYQWDVRAKAGVTVEQTREIRAALHVGSFPDRFDLSTGMGISTGPLGSAAGLLFRVQDYDNLYYLRLEDNGEVDFFALEAGEWMHIAGPVTAEAFVPGAQNVLRAVADGSRFSFWLNGAFLMEAHDGRFGTGAIGLAAELPAAGDEGLFVFDDIRVGVTAQ